MTPSSAEARALEDEIAGKLCIRCDSNPRVAVRDAQYAIVCNCDQGPLLGREHHVIERRYSKMVDQALANRPDEMPLSEREIQALICPLATTTEALMFLKFCRAHGLNPFLKEVHLIKYSSNDAAQIVIGIQALIRRADDTPDYEGYESGVIVKDQGGKTTRRPGSFYEDDEKLIGAWATSYSSRKRPLPVTVKFSEYDKGQALWKTKPGTMIEKCAIAQALRRMCPKVEDLFQRAQGMTVQVMDAEDLPDLVEEPPQLAEPEEAPTDAPEAASEAAPTQGERPRLDNIGDLLNAVKDRWGKTSPEVCATLNVKGPVNIKDFGAAWDELVKLWR